MSSGVSQTVLQCMIVHIVVLQKFQASLENESANACGGVEPTVAVAIACGAGV